MIISFEGIDFCGKSTQITKLSDYLKGKGYSVIVFREPGGVQLSEKIRELLLDPANVDMDWLTEMLLFFSSRNQFIHEKLVRSYRQYDFILLDRFFDSTFAYQGYGRGIELSKIANLVNVVVPSHLVPIRTFYIDIDIEEMQKRKKVRTADRIENQGVEFFNRVRDGYKTLCINNTRMVEINGAQHEEKVHASILEFMQDFIHAH